ncbi:MAG: hypothetical protein V7722_06675, partial [Porticoccus sp.]
EQVALYGAAAKLVLLTGIAMSVANGVLPPYISEFRGRGDIQGLQALLRRVATLASIPAIVLLIFLLLVPDWMMATVYGAGYAEAGGLLRVLAVGQLVNVMVGSCGYVLIMFGLSKLVMKIALVFGFIMLAGSYLLLELGHGSLAVAALVAFVMAFQQVTMLYFARKRCGVYTAIKLC